MAIRFKRVQRLCDPTNKEAGKKVYPVISYQYDTSAQSKGTEKAEDFTVSDISGLRVCFRANSDIRLFTGTSTRSDGLKFKDLDHINDSSIIDGDSGEGGEAPDPDGGAGGNGEAPDPAA